MNDKTASEEQQLERMLHGRDGTGAGSSFRNFAPRALMSEYMTVRDINDQVEVGTRITNARWLSVLSEYLDTCHKGMPFEQVAIPVLQDFSRRLSRPEQADPAGLPLPLTAPGQGFGYAESTATLIRIVVSHFFKWLHYREDQAKWPVLADGRRMRPPAGEPGAGWPASKKARARLPYPELVLWMLDQVDRRAMLLESNIKAEDCLTRDECFQMASVANERDAAMVMSYWDTGARREALIVLNVEHYKSDVTVALALGEQALLDLKGPLVRRMGVIVLPSDADKLKNEYARGARIPVVDAKSFLDALIRVHPFALWPFAPLFYSTHSRYFPKLLRKAAAYKAWVERCKGLQAKGMDEALAGPEPPQPTGQEFEKIRLTGNTVLSNLKNLAERAGIKKKVWTHLFRHSRARNLSPKLPQRLMKRRFTWAPGSPMPIKYGHLSAEDDDRAIARASGLEEEEAVAMVEGLNQPVRCPHGHLNKPSADFCFACNLPLDPKRLTASEHRIAESPVETLLKNPAVRAALTEALLRELGITTGALKDNGEPTPAFETTLKVAEARRVLADHGEAGA